MHKPANNVGLLYSDKNALAKLNTCLEIFILLGYCTPSLDVCCPTFQGHYEVSKN
jgi:hypothetical protein